MAATTPSQKKITGLPSDGILAGQLRRFGIDAANIPDDPPWFPALIEAVQLRYVELEMTSDRLEQDLRNLRSGDVARTAEHYLALFETTPVPTWEQDFEKVSAWIRDLRSSGVSDLPAYLDGRPEEFRRGVSLIEVTNANQAAADLLRVPDRVALLGPLPGDMLDDDSAPSFLAQFQAIWDSEDSTNTPVAGTRFDGTKFEGLLEWRVLRVAGTYDYSRVLLTVIDITDQKIGERLAMESLKSQDELLASVSHELRTPLAAVMGFAEILREMDQGDYEEERDGLLGIIANQASDLSDLVEDLLANARSELGKLDLASVPVNVHAQIAQVQESRAATDRPIRVPERPSTPVSAVGDPQRVRQILRNLVTNANRYGGQEIAIEVETASDQVKVVVLDNGDGLAPGSEDKIFDRYYREVDPVSHPGSVGLGLTIARDLARRMGGDLVYRRRDGWTAFELSLPAG
jgi:signal transduction histidine kinase